MSNPRISRVRVSPIAVLAWIAVLLLATAATAVERPMRFERLSLDRGLSQSTVLSIHQDSRGYVWIGTEDGLNRYDGLGFTVFKHDDTDPSSMPGNFVWAIDEDPQGNLWIGTEDAGVARFDREDDSFVAVESLGDAAIRALSIDDDGTVWVGSRKAGLYRIDAGSEAVAKAYRAATDGLGDDHVYAVRRDAAGRLWVGTDAGLVYHDASSDRFVTVPAVTDKQVRVRSILDDTDGKIWVGTFKNGAIRFDPASGETVHFRHDAEDSQSLSHDRVRALFQDAEGDMWVGTSAGLDRFDPKTQRFERHVNSPDDPHSLGDNHVMVVDQDRGGLIWVGTRFGGAQVYNPRSRNFGHHRLQALAEDDASSSRITAFAEDQKGQVWVGTFGGGLHVLNRSNDSMTVYRHDPEDPTSLSSDRVTSLRYDHFGRLWVGTIDAGLNVFDEETGRFWRYEHDPSVPDSLGADGVSSVLRDRAGRLWVGTFGGGVNRVVGNDGVFAHYRNDPDDENTLASDRITALAESSRGMLWVGTHGGGAGLLDPRTGEVSRYQNADSDPNSLASDLVYAMFVDSTGGLWIGTTGGLSYLASDQVASGTFKNYHERDGLPNEVIYGIEEDGSGNIWLSTNRGLSCLDRKSGTFRNFDERDGLQDDEFNFGAAYRSPSGEMYFGGIDGFNVFHPDRIGVNDHVPPVVLTAVSLSRRPVDVPADQVTEIDLGYRDRVVSFSFAALDFADPEENTYSYRLDGFDEEWVEAGTDNRATYTNLDPGEYTLQVRGANSEGVWNEDGIEVTLDVAPPPWKSPLAYGGYTFGVLSCLFGFVQVQRRKISREAEYSRVLEEQVRHRTSELAARTTELEQVNNRLVKASITDSLTGFANRRFLMDYLDKEIALVQRRYFAANAGTLERGAFDMAFLMIDLDDFKTINDTFGHSAGDEVLRELRTILDDACRQSDIVIRWGGDEFLVVARDLNAGGLDALADRIRTRIATHAFDVGDGQVVRTTCSIGYACYPFCASDLDAISWEQVIGIADRALYVSKRSGRNAWVGFESTDLTQPDHLLAALRHEAEGLVREGHMRIHTSLDGTDRVVEWNLED